MNFLKMNDKQVHVIENKLSVKIIFIQEFGTVFVFIISTY